MSDSGNAGRKSNLPKASPRPYTKRVEPTFESSKDSVVEASPSVRVESTKALSPLDSLTDWAKRIDKAAPTGASVSDLEAEGKRQYVASAPDPLPTKLSVEEQRSHMAHLQQMHASKDTSFTIYPQAHDKRAKKASPQEYMEENESRALSSFAYRFSPDPHREHEPSGKSGRLTINMDPKHSKEVASKLGQVLDDTESNPTLRAMKMMGPARLGQRVDDAVMYLKGHNPEAARQTAKHVTEALSGTKGALIDHTPPGMEHVATGISYAETKPGDSTSHGTARRKILAQAINQFRTNQKAFPSQEMNMQHHVQTAAFKAGYNPNMPSRVIRPERGALMKQLGKVGDSVAKGGKVSDTVKRVNKSK